MRSLNLNIIRTLQLLAGSAVAALVPNVAHANQYGELIVKKNTTLTDHRFGNVVIAADNVTLDCNNYQVHVSSFSKTDCVPSAGGAARKCGIAANDRRNITIKNCNVVGGGFDYGVMLSGTEDATVDHTQNVGAVTGFLFVNNSRLTAQNLVTNSNTEFGIEIDSDHDGEFNADSVGSAGSIGLFVHHSSGSSIFGPSIAYAGGTGIKIHASVNLLIDGASVQNCVGGGLLSARGSLEDILSHGITVSNGIFRWNNNVGLGSSFTNDSFFLNNIADFNASSDAWEFGSSGNTWSGNSFGTWSGTVPNAH